MKHLFAFPTSGEKQSHPLTSTYFHSVMYMLHYPFNTVEQARREGKYRSWSNLGTCLKGSGRDEAIFVDLSSERDLASSQSVDTDKQIPYEAIHTNFATNNF